MPYRFYSNNVYDATGTLTWEQAQAEAQKLGGNLVTINDLAEQNWLRSTFGSEFLWIGYTDKETEGNFKWVSGETSTYTNWGAEEPNNSGNEDYANLWTDGKWNDYGPQVTLRGIIEVPATMYYQGSFYVLTSNSRTWEQAQAEAQKRGGNLVTINNLAEQNWLRSTFGSEFLWIGYTDKETEGNFKWVSGETSTYTNWRAGQPDNSGNEDYAHLLTDGQWNDNTSQTTLRGIIEIPSRRVDSKYALTNSLTWEQAQAEAQRWGGNLVTINNLAEQNWLRSTFGSELLWIGYTDKETEGNFKWVSGETSTYTNWRAGQPDNWAGNEDYAHLWPDGQWNDNTSQTTLRGIIEIPKGKEEVPTQAKTPITIDESGAQQSFTVVTLSEVPTGELKLYLDIKSTATRGIAANTRKGSDYKLKYEALDTNKKLLKNEFIPDPQTGKNTYEITVPAGTKSIDLTVEPINDEIHEKPEQINITTLLPGGLIAKYYDNQTLTGNPVHSRIDPVLNFDWDVPQNLNVSWTGKLKTTTAGLYSFFSTGLTTAGQPVQINLTVNNQTSTIEGTTGVQRQLAANTFYDIKLEPINKSAEVSHVLLKWQIPNSNVQEFISANQLYYSIDEQQVTLTDNEPTVSITKVVSPTEGFGFGSTIEGLGSALKFAGATHIKEIPVSFSNQEFTQEAWIFVKDDSTSQGIFSFTDGNGNVIYSISVVNETGIKTNFAETAETINGVLNANSWNHIAATFDGDEYKLYINSVEIAATNQVGDLDITQAQYLTIGKVNSDVFLGAMDEVRLWDVVRTQGEIQNGLLNSLAGETAGLVGYWQFEENSSDISVNQNSGIVEGDLSYINNPAPQIGYVELSLDKPFEGPQGLWVEYDISGNATQNVDYFNSQTRRVSTDIKTERNGIIIPQGETSARIYVSAISDAVREGNEELTISLRPTNFDIFDRNNDGKYQLNSDYAPSFENNPNFPTDNNRILNPTERDAIGYNYNLGTNRTTTITIQDNGKYQPGVVILDQYNQGISADNPLFVNPDGTATVKVKLTSQPTGNVTIQHSIEIKNTLTFSPSNWDTTQTLNLRGLSSSGTVSLVSSVSSTDSNYQNLLPPEIVLTDKPKKVQITEGESEPDITPVVSINSSQNATEGSSEPGQFVINLSVAAPQGGLRINYISGEDTDIKTITIASGETSVILPIDVNDDNLAQGERRFQVRLQAGAGYELNAEAEKQTATIAIQDDDEPGIAIANETVSEDGTIAFTDSFTPLITSEPSPQTGDVIQLFDRDNNKLGEHSLTQGEIDAGQINITDIRAVNPGTDIRVILKEKNSPGKINLSYEPSPQTGDVIQLFDGDNNKLGEHSLTQGEIDAGQINITGITAVNPGTDIRVILKEKNGPGQIDFGNVLVAKDNSINITLKDNSIITLPQSQNTASLGMRLSSQPTADVTVNFENIDSTENTFSQTSLTFTPKNWDKYQTITVTGLEDNRADGDVFHIVTAVASSTDANYNRKLSFKVTNLDDDSNIIDDSQNNPGDGSTLPKASLNLVQPDGDELVAEGSTVKLQVNLDQPAGEGGALVFYSINGSDFNYKEDYILPYSEGGEEQSDTPLYTPLTAVYLKETPDGIELKPTDINTLSGTKEYVDLNADGYLDLVVDNTNYYQLQAINIPEDESTGVIDLTVYHDSIDEDDEAVTISLNAGDGYQLLDNEQFSIKLTVQDTDTAGVIITPESNGNSTSESGSSLTYGVRLNTQPFSDITTVYFGSSDSSEALLTSGESSTSSELIALQFTRENWTQTQTFTVIGQNDQIDDDNIAYKIFSSVSSDDPKYQQLNITSISLENTDDADAAGITTNLEQTLVEGVPKPNAYSIKLTSEPSTSVRVIMTPSNDQIQLNNHEIGEPVILNFDATNWNQEQVVGFTALDDQVVEYLHQSQVYFQIQSDNHKYGEPKGNNNSPENAILVGNISDGYQWAGLKIGTPGDVDWYKFTLPETGTLEDYIDILFDNSQGWEAKLYRNSRYVLTENLTWEAAQAEAQRLGGNLVTINSQAEQEWLVNRFGSTQPLWIGYTDREDSELGTTEGTFKWVSGQVSAYTNWDQVTTPDQDYGVMLPGGTWSDEDVTASFPGIVEIPSLLEEIDITALRDNNRINLEGLHASDYFLEVSAAATNKYSLNFGHIQAREGLKYHDPDFTPTPLDVSITDNDIPTVKILTGLRASEVFGQPGYFTIALNAPTPQKRGDTGIKVNYRILGGTATLNTVSQLGDYRMATDGDDQGFVRIAPGDIQNNLIIVPIDDKLVEDLNLKVSKVKRLDNGNLELELSQPSGIQGGLTGKYYQFGTNPTSFTSEGLASATPVFTRNDATVNFVWGTSGPISGVLANDFFAVVWEGNIKTTAAGTYQFHTASDDGVRLYVNGQKIIDKWQVQSSTEHSGSITLAANTEYKIKLEYYENTDFANVALSWTPPSGIKQIIPADQSRISDPNALPIGSTIKFADNIEAEVLAFDNGKVTVKPNTTIHSIAVGDDAKLAAETVTVELLPGEGYILDTAATQGTLQILDDDVPGIRIVEVGRHTVVREGETATFEISLLSEPTKPVNITLTPGAEIEFVDPINPNTVNVEKYVYSFDTGNVRDILSLELKSLVLTDKGQTVAFEVKLPQQPTGKQVVQFYDANDNPIDNVNQKRVTFTAQEFDTFEQTEVDGNWGEAEQLTIYELNPDDNGKYAITAVIGETKYNIPISFTKTTVEKQSTTITIQPQDWYKLQTVTIQGSDDDVIEPGLYHADSIGYEVTSTDTDYHDIFVPTQTIHVLDRILDSKETASTLSVGLATLKDSIDDLSLPLIGQLDGVAPDLIGEFSQELIDTVAQTDNLTAQKLKEVIEEVLGGIGLDDFTVSVSVTTDEISALIDLSKTYNLFTIPLSTDLGIPALGIGLETEGNLEANFNYGLSLGFGLHKDFGFYIDTESTGFKTDVTVDLDQFTGQGSVGFLKLKFDDDSENPTKLEVSFQAGLNDLDNYESIRFFDANGNGQLDANTFTFDINGDGQLTDADEIREPFTYVNPKGAANPFPKITDNQTPIENKRININGNTTFDEEQYIRGEGIYRNQKDVSGNVTNYYFDSNRNSKLDTGELSVSAAVTKWVKNGTLTPFRIENKKVNGVLKYYFDENGNNSLENSEEITQTVKKKLDKNNNFKLDGDQQINGEGEFIQGIGIAFLDANSNGRLDYGESYVNSGFGELSIASDDDNNYLDINDNAVEDPGEPKRESGDDLFTISEDYVITKKILVNRSGQRYIDQDDDEIYDGDDILAIDIAEILQISDTDTDITFVDVNGDGIINVDSSGYTEPRIYILEGIRFVDLDYDGKLKLEEEPISQPNNQFDTSDFPVDGEIVTFLDDGSRLTITELLNFKSDQELGFSDLFNYQFAGEANLGLNTETSIDNNAAFPSFTFDLAVNLPLFNYNNQGEAGDNGLSVNFNTITLDLGTFLSDVVQPMMTTIDDIITPVKPIIKVLNADTKIFSYIGLESAFNKDGRPGVSLLDIAKTLNPSNPKIDQAIKFADTITSIINVIDTIKSTLSTNGDSILIQMGSYSLEDFKAASKDETDAAANVKPSKGSSTTSAKPVSNLTPDTREQAKNSGVINKLNNLEGLDIPLINNPITAISLLLGEKDVDLITYDIPDFDFSFDIQRGFPIFPGITGLLEGSFQAKTDLAVGYDTHGIEAWQESDFSLWDAYKVFDGFYLNDLDATGNDKDELSVKARIAAGVAASAVVVSAALKGGLEGYIGFDLQDVGERTGTSDGKIRGSEIISRLSTPLELFELYGDISAFLNAEVKVGIDLGFFQIMKTVWSIDFARFKIAEFKVGGGSGFSGSVAQAAIANSLVFFDADFDGILNEGEPFTFTDRSGNYQLDVSDNFDVNGNGIIDETEGRLVAQGGIDVSSGLPMESQLFAIPQSSMITPLTSLKASLVRKGTTPEDAEQKIKSALDLPDGINLDEYDPLKAIGQGQQDGVEVYKSHIQIQNLIVHTTNFVNGLSTDASDSEIINQVIDIIAEEIAAQEDDFDIKGEEIVGNILTKAVKESDAIDLPDKVNTLVEIVIQSNASIEEKSEGIDIVSVVSTLAPIKKYIQGELTQIIQEVGNGTITSEKAMEALETITQQDYFLVDEGLGAFYTGVVSIYNQGDISESGLNPGKFEISLSDPAPKQGINIFYSLAGSATLGEDYNFDTPLNTSIYIHAGETSATISLSSLDDAVYEMPETIYLQLQSASEGYIIDPSAQGAAIKIIDNDVNTITPIPPNPPLNLQGTLGDDNKQGDTGNDVIFGDYGDDSISGIEGNDTLLGGHGDDTLIGGEGNDLLKGHYGDDTLKGEAGDDTLDGGAGNDILQGGNGNDWLRGAIANDILDGGSGNDWLIAGEGNDLLVASLGDDVLIGGQGADRFIFTSSADGFDTISDFDPSQGDRIQIVASGFNTTTLDGFQFRNGVLEFNGERLARIQNQGKTYQSFFNLSEVMEIISGVPSSNPVNTPINTLSLALTTNSVTPESITTTATTEENTNLLEEVITRGYVKVAVTNDTTEFEKEQGKAIASALFGNSNQIEFITLDSLEIFPAVVNGTVDIAVTGVTPTLDRDSRAVDFGPVFFYDTQGVLVRADSNINNALDLSNRTIGILEDFYALDNLQSVLTPAGIEFTPQVFNSTAALLAAYEQGTIDAVSLSLRQLSEIIPTLTNPDNQQLLDVEFSQTPLATILPENQSAWADVVRWITYVPMQAEALGITSENVEQLINNSNSPEIQQFLGVDNNLGLALGIPNDFTFQVIKNIGNYGQLYERHFGNLERNRNHIWLNDGALYSLPFTGTVIPNVNLIDNDQRNVFTEVLTRGTVKLGIVGDDPGEYEGFDIDLGKAIAAAVFGDATKLEIVTDTFANGFTNTANGIVDIAAMAITHNIIRDATLGIDYSPIYLYTGQGLLVRKNSGINSIPMVSGQKVGVVQNTTSVQNLQDYLATLDVTAQPIIFPTDREMFAAYDRGEIDAVSTDLTILAAAIATLSQPDNHRILNEQISREPLGLIIDENQSDWGDVVKWVTYTLIQAEELGITSQNINQLVADNTDTSLDNDSSLPVREFLGIERDFGARLGLPNDFSVKIIQAVGNYGEIYQRHFDQNIISRDQNQLFDNFGLQFAPTFRDESLQQITSLENLLIGSNANVTIPLIYNTSTNDNTLTGITLRLHYDSQQLTFTETTNLFETNLLNNVTDTPDTTDIDNDPTTDRYLELQYTDDTGNWPNQPLPLKLADFNFSTSSNFSGTQLNVTSDSLAPVQADAIIVGRQTWNLDIDGNGKIEALSDGIMAVRYMFGGLFGGDKLIAGAIASDATRNLSEIQLHLQEGVNNRYLDIDGNGKIEALSDGIMAVRYMFGGLFGGDRLIAGAIASDATRDVTAVQAYLAALTSI